MNTDDRAALGREIDAHDKRFSSLRAMLARHNYELYVLDGGHGTASYLIRRWDRSREVPDTDAVEAFLRQLGE